MSWTFITNHGAVLILISQHEQITTRAIASQLGITERSVMRIINDLVEAGFASKTRVGRVNFYTVNPQAPLRRDDNRHVAVGDLLKILGPEPGGSGEA